MKVHFIAIGGSAMHNLAIALHLKGDEVTGSDDQIFDPSKGRLEKYGLLPQEFGWFPEKITNKLDAIILGMHAREDNPELKKAQELGLTIYSYPEYIYEQTKDKTRVVIGGSHGKTTITSMILHVLNQLNIENDYMVGAQLEGFECMVKLTDSAKIAILEGDEYLSSPIDRRPKFHLYRPNIALLSGIAWDHINVFPTFENYVWQFEEFVRLIEPQGSLIWFEEDKNIEKITQRVNGNYTSLPYSTLPYSIEDGITYIDFDGKKIQLGIFGEHNLQNLHGALLVCEQLGINKLDFLEAISSFTGASKRLELIGNNGDTKVYKDFAHSPSKLKATTKSLKQQFPKKRLLACMELHTFSSLNKEFMSQYHHTMASADKAVVFFSPQAVAHKKLDSISKKEVENAFGKNQVQVIDNTEELLQILYHEDWTNTNLLLMSSGNFGGLNLEELAENIVGLGG